MSDCDQIIINDTTTSDYVVINDNITQDNVNVITEGSLVTSVNGRVGTIILTNADFNLNQVDNTSDLNKPISNATLSALLLKTDLSAFNVLNNFILSKYGSWDSVYVTVNGLTSNQDSTYSLLNSNSANWNYAYNTVVGGLSSDLWNSTYTNFSQQSSNNISVYAYVNANSGIGQNQQFVTTFIINNSSDIINVDSLVNSNSSNWNYSFDWVTLNQNNAKFNSVSAISLSGVFYGDGSHLIGAALPNQVSINTVVTSNSSNWNSVYSTVSSNSALNWNYQGTDIKSISSNWVGGNIAYTNLITNSSAYLSSVNLSFLSVSGNWNKAYDISTSYQNTSGSFSTNTLLQSTSGLLTPLTITSNLTSQLLKTTDFNSYQTSFASSTSTLLPTSVYQNTSSSFVQNTVINNVSGNWNSAYTNISNLSTTYGAVTAINGTTYQIQAINNNGSVVLTIPNSFRTPGDLNVGGNLYVAGSGIVLNTSTLSLSSPILYLNNSLSDTTGNVYDIGFVGHFKSGIYQHTGLVRSAQNNYWSLFSGLTSEPLDSPTLNYSNPTFTIDTLRANILGSLSGNVTGNVTGNAGSVTNGVYTNGSYSDPSWIASLADTKISGNKFATNSYLNNSFLPLSGGVINGRLGVNNTPLYFDLDLSSVGNSYGDLGLGSSNNILINPNNNLVLTQNIGNVGIGVTNPTQKLDVNGNVNVSGNATILGTLCAVGGIVFTGNGSSVTDYAFLVEDIYGNTLFAVNSSNTSIFNTPLYVGGNVTTPTGNSTQWNSVYTSVQSNSATNWNYQGTDIKLLSGNWQSTYTTVSSNISNWNTAYNVATSYQNVSGSFLTNTNFLTSYTNNTTLGSLTATLLPISIYQNASGSFLTSIPISLSANWQNASDSLDYILINSNFNAIVNRKYLVDTSSTTVSGVLPSSPAIGDNISFVDSANTWGIRPLILDNNGKLLQTYNEALTANISGYQFQLVYVGGSYGWKIV